jgi:hypothetical protein
LVGLVADIIGNERLGSWVLEARNVRAKELSSGELHAASFAEAATPTQIRPTRMILHLGALAETKRIC